MYIVPSSLVSLSSKVNEQLTLSSFVKRSFAVPLNTFCFSCLFSGAIPSVETSVVGVFQHPTSKMLPAIITHTINFFMRKNKDIKSWYFNYL
jgi:hypothetical protein